MDGRKRTMKQNISKNFYFVRHGETDHNVKHILHDETDITLNERGVQQAQKIQPVIERLPVQMVCVSPLLRAKQTKAIITENLPHPEVVIEDLKECSGDVWLKFMEYERQADARSLESVDPFFSRVKSGLDYALSHPGPVLIVAH